MKFLTVVGARPQFIKAAVVSRAVRSRLAASHDGSVREVLVHTGQHYDASMSQVFFDELDIPNPDHHLGVGSGSHGAQTGAMLERLESVMVEEKPDVVLVYGDTNSTLAGALAAAKLHIPVAHVEAGLRSFNRRMPEEINRVMTDHLSTLLFCPTETAIDNLRLEGLPHVRRPEVKVIRTGDVMFDAALFYGARAEGRSLPAGFDGLHGKDFILATIHRAENTDDSTALGHLLEALERIGERLMPVVWPVHPRTRHLMERDETLRHICSRARHLRMVEPLGYLDMVAAERRARLVLTDSGGVQKEAFFHGKPCVTMRTETEWVELVDAGWNTIAGIEPEAIMTAVEGMLSARLDPANRPPLYGDGHAGEAILEVLIGQINEK